MDPKVICQSCAMPLNKDEVCGTNADGSKNKEYCRYCYQKGSFTAPNITLKEMIDKLVGFHAKMNMTEVQARQLAEKILPTLNRWKKK